MVKLGIPVRCDLWYTGESECALCAAVYTLHRGQVQGGVAQPWWPIINLARQRMWDTGWGMGDGQSRGRMQASTCNDDKTAGMSRLEKGDLLLSLMYCIIIYVQVLTDMTTLPDMRQEEVLHFQKQGQMLLSEQSCIEVCKNGIHFLNILYKKVA